MTPSTNDSKEPEQLLKQLEQSLAGLLAIQKKAREKAHIFAMSFADHPKGCVYCEPDS